MSDTSTSNEVGKKNLYENYKYTDDEIIWPTFYDFTNTKESLLAATSNPSSTGNAIEVNPKEAGSFLTNQMLLVGMIEISAEERTPEMDKKIMDSAERSGGVGKGGALGYYNKIAKLKQRNNAGIEKGQ